MVGGEDVLLLHPDAVEVRDDRVLLDVADEEHALAGAGDRRVANLR